jgi:hypothetical protein
MRLVIILLVSILTLPSFCKHRKKVKRVHKYTLKSVCNCDSIFHLFNDKKPENFYYTSNYNEDILIPIIIKTSCFNFSKASEIIKSIGKPSFVDYTEKSYLASYNSLLIYDSAYVYRITNSYPKNYLLYVNYLKKDLVFKFYRDSTICSYITPLPTREDIKKLSPER